MLSNRSISALVFAIATFVGAESAFAQREVTVTNNAGMPIKVQIGPRSFDLQPGGVARATLNTTKPPVICINTISASGVFPAGSNDAIRPQPVTPGTQPQPGAWNPNYPGAGTGSGGNRNPPRTVTVRANPVQTNICKGGRTSFSVTRSGQTLRIN